MAEQSHHHHHHRHHKDEATRFKERSLKEIRLRKTIGVLLKKLLIVLAIIMGLAVLIAYSVG